MQTVMTILPLGLPDITEWWEGRRESAVTLNRPQFVECVRFAGALASSGYDGEMDAICSLWFYSNQQDILRALRWAIVGTCQRYVKHEAYLKNIVYFQMYRDILLLFTQSINHDRQISHLLAYIREEHLGILERLDVPILPVMK